MLDAFGLNPTLWLAALTVLLAAPVQIIQTTMNNEGLSFGRVTQGHALSNKSRSAP